MIDPPESDLTDGLTWTYSTSEEACYDGGVDVFENAEYAYTQVSDSGTSYLTVKEYENGVFLPDDLTALDDPNCPPQDCDQPTIVKRNPEQPTE